MQFVAEGVLDALVDILGFAQPVSFPETGQVIDFRRATFVFTSMDGGVANVVRDGGLTQGVLASG
jgi:hypothetical protein